LPRLRPLWPHFSLYTLTPECGTLPANLRVFCLKLCLLADFFLHKNLKKKREAPKKEKIPSLSKRAQRGPLGKNQSDGEGKAWVCGKAPPFFGTPGAQGVFPPPFFAPTLSAPRREKNGVVPFIFVRGQYVMELASTKKIKLTLPCYGSCGEVYAGGSVLVFLLDFYYPISLNLSWGIQRFSTDTSFEFPWQFAHLLLFGSFYF